MKYSEWTWYEILIGIALSIWIFYVLWYRPEISPCTGPEGCV